MSPLKDKSYPGAIGYPIQPRCAVTYTFQVCEVHSKMFAQRQKHVTTHFSEHIPAIQGCRTVLEEVSLDTFYRAHQAYKKITQFLSRFQGLENKRQVTDEENDLIGTAVAWVGTHHHFICSGQARKGILGKSYFLKYVPVL